jgi:predicted enzyme related to lactoylglutathione lyase
MVWSPKRSSPRLPEGRSYSSTSSEPHGTTIVDGLQAVTVHVTDLEKARRFYSSVLGLEEERGNPEIPRAVFKIPGTATRLTMHVTTLEEGGREPGTVSGVLFRCPDPESACLAIEQNGGTVVDKPWNMHRGGVTIVRAVIADPDGNEFILSSAL